MWTNLLVLDTLIDKLPILTQHTFLSVLSFPSSTSNITSDVASSPHLPPAPSHSSSLFTHFSLQKALPLIPSLLSLILFFFSPSPFRLKYSIITRSDPFSVPLILIELKDGTIDSGSEGWEEDRMDLFRKRERSKDWEDFFTSILHSRYEFPSCSHSFPHILMCTIISRQCMSHSLRRIWFSLLLSISRASLTFFPVLVNRASQKRMWFW